MAVKKSRASPKHPSPQRYKIRRWHLLVGIFGAPFSWVVLMSGSYSLASRACYPHRSPITAPLWDDLNLWIYALSFLCLLGGLVSMSVAYKAWQKTKEEKKGGKKKTVDVGEGRARFLAMFGILLSCLFVLAIIFTSCGILLVSVCSK